IGCPKRAQPQDRKLMPGILVFFHCQSNTGYAIKALERAFFQAAESLYEGDWRKIHFAYPDLSQGFPTALPADFRNVVRFDPAAPEDEGQFVDYIKSHEIDIALGFDQPVWRSSYRLLRNAGIKRFISYWGAPMSSPN